MYSYTQKLLESHVVYRFYPTSIFHDPAIINDAIHSSDIFYTQEVYDPEDICNPTHPRATSIAAMLTLRFPDLKGY